MQIDYYHFPIYPDISSEFCEQLGKENYTDVIVPAYLPLGPKGLQKANAYINSPEARLYAAINTNDNTNLKRNYRYCMDHGLLAYMATDFDVPPRPEEYANDPAIYKNSFHSKYRYQAIERVHNLLGYQMFKDLLQYVPTSTWLHINHAPKKSHIMATVLNANGHKYNEGVELHNFQTVSASWLDTYRNMNALYAYSMFAESRANNKNAVAIIRKITRLNAAAHIAVINTCNQATPGLNVEYETLYAEVAMRTGVQPNVRQPIDAIASRDHAIDSIIRDLRATIYDHGLAALPEATRAIEVDRLRQHMAAHIHTIFLDKVLPEYVGFSSSASQRLRHIEAHPELVSIVDTYDKFSGEQETDNDLRRTSLEAECMLAVA